MKNFQATYEDRWPHGGYSEKIYIITAENKERALDLALEILFDNEPNTKEKWTIEELESNEEYVYWISSSSS